MGLGAKRVGFYSAVPNLYIYMYAWKAPSEEGLKI